MTDNDEMTNLGQLLDRLSDATRDHEKVALGTMVEAVGRRSFGPLLLVAGLVAVSPLSGIPGVPTIVAIIVGLIAGQLLLRRKTFWLPGWLLRRSFSRSKFDRALRIVRPPARFVDRLLRPRLTALTYRTGAYAIAVLCILIACSMPPMELIPFAATTAGAAITAFGLALVAHDGLVALIALLLTGGTAGAAIYRLL